MRKPAGRNETGGCLEAGATGRGHKRPAICALKRGKQEDGFERLLLRRGHPGVLGWMPVGMAIDFFTLGIAHPWAYCLVLEWKTRYTLIGGKRLVFRGTGMGCLAAGSSGGCRPSSRWESTACGCRFPWKSGRPATRTLPPTRLHEKRRPAERRRCDGRHPAEGHAGQVVRWRTLGVFSGGLGILGQCPQQLPHIRR